MISRKKIITSTLLAAVLLTIVIVPMSTQQGGSTYDPWLDYNEDGVIDVNDLHPLGGAYGTTGDPTKNVNVTNWPKPMDVNVTNWSDLSTQGGLFPRNLVLRGACQGPGGWPTVLIDETAAPCQLLKSGYDAMGKTINETLAEIYNQTFIYTNPATHNFQILGRPFAGLTFNVTNSPASWFSMLFYAWLGTISMNGEWTMINPLNMDGFTLWGENTDLQRISLMMNLVPFNVVVGSLERLAIRIVVYAQTMEPETDTYVYCKVLCGTDTDYFTVNVPIVENP